MTGLYGWKLYGWKQACFVFVLCAAMAISLSAQTLTTLESFSGLNGNNPYGGLVEGSDGSLYGTTIDGGLYGGGTVFRIAPSGGMTSLYNFCSLANCADGQYPVTTLIQSGEGDFVGTTQSGGSEGWGTVFRITPDGRLTTVHSFVFTDGAAPYGTLVLASNGDFYGTTNGGGDFNAGTVFRMTPGGTVTTLHVFCSGACADGEYSVGALIQASDGNIYGTTHAGGNFTACSPDGCGTIFRITPGGTLTTLHTFDSIDGAYPYGGIVEGAKGMFYGTTGGGGPANWGTVFQMTRTGAVTVLHTFSGPDGSNPYGLIKGSDGNFYGTTAYGGPVFNYGTIFKVTPAGGFTTLLGFDGTNGKNPFVGVFQAASGMFYGTTYFGGTDSDGTAFSMSVGLSGAARR